MNPRSNPEAFRPLRLTEAQPGVQAWDKHEGPVTLRGSARYIPGGYAVDAVCTLWNGREHWYTAVLCNLRVRR